MKKYLLCFSTLLMILAASSAFAGHDHGAPSSGVPQGSSHGPADEQAAKTSEQLLKSCVQHVDSIQRSIDRLQAKMTERRSLGSINDELEKLEQKLKEAKELARSLQIF